MKRITTPLLTLALLAAPACGEDKKTEETPTKKAPINEAVKVPVETAKVATGDTPKETVKEEPADATKPGEIPWDFAPQKELKADVGQLALGIDPYRLRDAQKAEDPNKEFGMSYTNFVVTEVGEFESKVKRVSEVTLANSLIIPLPKVDPAKKGDVLFTWWQSGGGLQHAIVVGGSETEPEVWYMDLADSIDDAKKTHILAPSSFAVLGTDLEPGIDVVWDEGEKTLSGTVLNVGADKLLVMAYNNIRTAPLTATPVPVVPGVKKGDVVWFPGYGKSEEGKVKKVDAKKGKVTIEGTSGEKIVPFGKLWKK